MLSTISLLNEDFDRYVCDHKLKRQRDGFYTSTGRQVTAHNTSHPAGPLHLEWEECDLLRCIRTQL